MKIFQFEAKMRRKYRLEAKRSEKIGPLFSLEHAKTMQNGSRFASFRFEAKKVFLRNRRTLGSTYGRIVHGKDVC
jgi:hypothetical protein